MKRRLCILDMDDKYKYVYVKIPKGLIRFRNSKFRQYNDNGQNDKLRSTKHTHKTKDRVTGTPLKTGGELMCSRRVSSSCSTSGTVVLI